MNIKDTQRCNKYNLINLGSYLQIDPNIFLSYYEELSNDIEFIDDLNGQMKLARNNYNFTKGIFSKTSVDSIDWFAFQRVLLYVLIRHFKPQHCLETGVFYGGNTTFILKALSMNKTGLLTSIDLPDSKHTNHQKSSRHPWVGDSEHYQESLKPGFLAPPYLHEYWNFIEGDSLKIIPELENEFAFYIHDSEHSFNFLLNELDLTFDKMQSNGIMIVDDIPWSNAFFKFCVDNKLYPTFFTDNGKSGLQVRTGMIQLDHPKSKVTEVVGL